MINFKINEIIGLIIEIIKEVANHYVIRSRKWLRDFKAECITALNDRFSESAHLVTVIGKMPKIYGKPTGILLMINTQPRTYICVDFLPKSGKNFILKVRKKLEEISKNAEEKNHKVAFALILVSDGSKPLYIDNRSFNSIVSLKYRYRNIIDVIIKRIYLKRLSFELPCTIEPNEHEKALSYIKEILNLAKREIIIVDPYINSEILELISMNINPQVDVILVTGHGKRENPLKKHQKLIAICHQYCKKHGTKMKLYSSDIIHDRWIIIDRNMIFSIGISLKDLGKRKVSTIDKLKRKISNEIISKVIKEIIPNSGTLFTP